MWLVDGYHFHGLWKFIWGFVVAGCSNAVPCSSQFKFSSVFSECRWSCGICVEFASTTWFYGDVPQGAHPGQMVETAAWPSGYPQRDSVAVCSLQLPPLRMSSPASISAKGKPFFIFFVFLVGKWKPVHWKGQQMCSFAQIPGFILWSLGVTNRSSFGFILGAIKQLHEEWGKGLKLSSNVCRGFLSEQEAI